MSHHIEHFLFFPVVVLLSIILIVISFKLIIRLLVLFFVVLALWYCLSFLGVVSSPNETFKQYRKPILWLSEEVLGGDGASYLSKNGHKRSTPSAVGFGKKQ